MKGKRNMKKVLSVILVLVMVLAGLTNGSARNVQAAMSSTKLATTYLNTTLKYLNFANQDATTYHFDIKKEAKKKGASYIWYVKQDKGDPKAVSIDKKTGVVTAKRGGTAYIRCKITLSDGTILRPEAKVVVRNNIKEVDISNMPDNQILTAGETMNFNRSILNTDAGKGKVSKGITRWEIKEDTAGIDKISNSGIVFPTKNGSFSIRAVCFQSKEKYSLWLADKEANLKYITASSKWYKVTVEDSKGQATVSTQLELDKALASEEITQITIATEKEVEFNIAEADYSNKLLIVDAPNADVDNYAIFKSISIKAIKENTWRENAEGNTFHVTSIKVRIIVNGKAEVKEIIVDQENSVINLEVDGKVHQITILQPSELDLSGSGNQIPLTIEKTGNGSKITTSIPVKLECDDNSEIVLNPGSEGSAINKSNGAVELKIENHSNETVIITTDNTGGETVNPGESAISNDTTQPIPTPVPPSGGGKATTPTLKSIAIKTPADKTVYMIGELLDITGLVVEGTYSNSRKKVEPITLDSISGFDSSAVVDSQILTVTVRGKKVTYTVDIVPIPISEVSITGNTEFGVSLVVDLNPSDADVLYQWTISNEVDGTYQDVLGATSATLTLTDEYAGKYMKVNVTGTGNYSGLVISDAVGPIIPDEFTAIETVNNATNVDELWGALQAVSLNLSNLKIENKQVYWAIFVLDDDDFEAVDGDFGIQSFVDRVNEFTNKMLTDINTVPDKNMLMLMLHFLDVNNMIEESIRSDYEGLYFNLFKAHTEDFTTLQQINDFIKDINDSAIPVETITVIGAEGATEVVNGGTLQMCANITPLNATNQSVIWYAETITGSASISGEGLLTGVEAGTVRVHATNEAFGITGTIEISVITVDKLALAAAITTEVGTDHDNPSMVLNEVDYMPITWANYDSALTDALEVEANCNSLQIEVNAALTALELAKAALVFTNQAALDEAIAAAEAKVEATYTTASWLLFINARTIAMDLPVTTNDEVAIKTTALNDAVALLVELADLTAYNAALAAVTETDYTIASWAAYQLVLDTIIITEQDLQSEVDLATLTIITAQESLIEIADLTAYLAAIVAVTEADYTIASWVAYLTVLDANIVTEQNLQTEVDAATLAITTAQESLIELADVTAYNAAIAAVTEADYTTASWAEYQLVLDVNIVTEQNLQSEVDAATLAITTAQESLIEIADLTAYLAAIVAVTEADYTTASWVAYQTVLAANIVTEQNLQTEVDAATANIVAAQNDLLLLANVTAYNAAIAAVTEADYTAASWVAYQLVLDANIVTEQNLQSEVDAATLAITTAQESLIELADLTAYNAAIAAVTEADYTTASWAVYQLVLDVNIVTEQNLQTEVDAATANIVAAQNDLLLLANVTAYNAAIAAVTEADYTTASWAVYQLVLDANIVTEQNLQSEVDAATLAITTAQESLIEIADVTAYNAAIAAVTEADYTTASWAAYQTVLAANVVTEQNLQTEVDAATANIVAAQEGLVFAGLAALEAAKTDAAGKIEADYTTDSWVTFNTALSEANLLPESTNAEVVAKTTAINNAVTSLVVLTYVIEFSSSGSTSFDFGTHISSYDGYGMRIGDYIEKTGTGDITNLNGVLTGANPEAFILDLDSDNPWVTTLDNTRYWNDYRIYPKDGLASGTYSATATFTADHGVILTYQVSFGVS